MASPKKNKKKVQPAVKLENFAVQVVDNGYMLYASFANGKSTSRIYTCLDDLATAINDLLQIKSA